MIDHREILAITGIFGLLLQVVERDYVLDWVLAGIAWCTVFRQKVSKGDKMPEEYRLHFTLGV